MDCATFSMLRRWMRQRAPDKVDVFNARILGRKGVPRLIRLADYIAHHLADHGVHHVFMVTGGGAMFLNNAFGTESRIACICNHHEQASAMAAEGYARTCGALGVVNVTAGPGGINALNGVFGRLDRFGADADRFRPGETRNIDGNL